jgi:hypothetical protein
MNLLVMGLMMGLMLVFMHGKGHHASNPPPKQQESVLGSSAGQAGKEPSPGCRDVPAHAPNLNPVADPKPVPPGKPNEEVSQSH